MKKIDRDVIVALDFNSKNRTLEFLDLFKDEKLYVKVGMELFYKEGAEIVHEIKKRGHKIFLDLKLHDIPNTVKKATESIMALDCDMINFHIAGGYKMLKDATDIAKEINPDIITLGITILTSITEEIMHDEINIDKSLDLENIVSSYANMGKNAGLSGVVCSAKEVPIIKKELGEKFICVTPGIRLAGDSKDDQKRVVTPEYARELGSDFIVVGRSITKSENPVESYRLVKKLFLGE